MLLAFLLTFSLGCAAGRAPERSVRIEERRALAGVPDHRALARQHRGALERAEGELDPAIRAELLLQASALCEDIARSRTTWAAAGGQTDPAVARWWGRAVEGYEGFLAEYPDNERTDAALYGLGHALMGLDRDEEALAAWGRLTQERPGSPWAGRAWLEIGDYRLDHREPALARGAYARAAGDPNVGGSARYKLAWALLRLDEREQALAELRALAASEPPGALRAWAIKDIAEIHVTAGRPEQALAEAEALIADPAEAALLLPLIASTLDLAGFPDQAARARRRAAELAPR